MPLSAFTSFRLNFKFQFRAFENQTEWLSNGVQAGSEIVSYITTVAGSCHANLVPMPVKATQLTNICLAMHPTSGSKFCKNPTFLRKFRKHISCNLRSINLTLKYVSVEFDLTVPFFMDSVDHQSFQYSMTPFVKNNKILKSNLGNGVYITGPASKLFFDEDLSLLTHDQAKSRCAQAYFEKNTSEISKYCHFTETNLTCLGSYHHSGLILTTVEPISVRELKNNIFVRTFEVIGTHFFDFSAIEVEFECNNHKFRSTPDKPVKMEISLDALVVEDTIRFITQMSTIETKIQEISEKGLTVLDSDETDLNIHPTINSSVIVLSAFLFCIVSVIIWVKLRNSTKKSKKTLIHLLAS